MLSARTLYPAVCALLQAMAVVPHRSAQGPVAHVVSALLVGQSLHASVLMRMLPSAPTVPAAQRYRRLRRAWSRAWLTSAWLTPCLVRAALALCQQRQPPVVALDSVRCGGWEIFTVGLVWHRRCLLLGWSVLPYPWPKGRFTPTVCALVSRVAAAWPPSAPAPHLVADRGFPSRAFFATLAACGWAFTVRLRSRDWVTVGQTGRSVRSLWKGLGAGVWQQWPAHYGTRAGGPAGWVTAGRGLPVLAWHQRDDGSARARAEQQRVHRVHLRHKYGPTGPGQALETDAWMVLFSSQPGWCAALRVYRHRWSIEGTYRDLQGGWDGRVGWDLERVVSRDADAGLVEARIGLAALGLVCQIWLGDQMGRRAAPDAVRQLARQWTTSGRLSPWARGRLLLSDRQEATAAWVVRQIHEQARRLAAVATMTEPTRRSRPPRRHAA